MTAAQLVATNGRLSAEEVFVGIRRPENLSELNWK
jgi:hypothetical protein